MSRCVQTFDWYCICIASHTEVDKCHVMELRCKLELKEGTNLLHAHSTHSGLTQVSDICGPDNLV